MRRFTIPIDGVATLLIAYSALQSIGDDGQLDADTLDEIQCIRPKLDQLIRSIKSAPVSLAVESKDTEAQQPR